MTQKKIGSRPSEAARVAQLNALIHKTYAHLAPDDIEVLVATYDKSETRMFEVVEVRAESVVLMDLYADLEFKPARLPKEFTSLLKRHDVFLSTIGLKASVWAVLYLSPSYDTETF